MNTKALVRKALAPALATAVAVGSASTAAAVAAADAPPPGGEASTIHSRNHAGGQLAALRKDLAPYKDVTVALADGFVPVSGCEESPEGGMGVHYLNPQRAAAPIDADEPAILLYAPTTDGGMRLLVAEWFQPDADQDLTTTDDRPSLWGQPFNGPMAGHDPTMPVHYDLHVWLFDNNPAGVFAGWNPSVSC